MNANESSRGQRDIRHRLAFAAVLLGIAACGSNAHDTPAGADGGPPAQDGGAEVAAAGDGGSMSPDAGTDGDGGMNPPAHDGGPDGSPTTTTHAWIWETGASVADQPSVVGALGVAAPSNTPCARDSASTWTDAAGGLWIFGGYGCGDSGNAFFSAWLNDVWKYSAGEWTLVNAGGERSFGQVGVAAASNLPPPRDSAASWVDSAGSAWIFGGDAQDPMGYEGEFNDLWRYAAGEWTWMGGVGDRNPVGVYGTMGVAAPANTPGGRTGSVTFTDAAGGLWLFGGYGMDGPNSQNTYDEGELEDLWKYEAGQWTWMAGSSFAWETAVYGTKGSPSPSNAPGGRESAVAWTDGAGNFWVFGGLVRSIGSTPDHYYDDLWRYSSGQWTWMSGSNAFDQAGTYGTEGMPSAGSSPGGRQGAVAFTDAAGNLWLFGGQGYDAAGALGYLNDLWRYSAGQWTWMSGSSLAGQAGTYGKQGVAGASGVPGARVGAASWTDGAGKLWLFGGEDGYTMPPEGDFNDLWQY